jgi:hypothetical protein
MFDFELLGKRLYIHTKTIKKICVVNINETELKIMIPSPLEIDLLIELTKRLTDLKENLPLSQTDIKKIFN